MPPRAVTVTYTLHPSPSPSSSTSSPLFSALTGLKTHLPLRNLHWKPSTRTSLRTIQEVDVDLIELGEAGPGAGAGKDVAGSVLESPLVNICLVQCEDSEVYKTQTRNFIRDWLSLLAARRNAHAPLIVLVNPASAVAAGHTGKNVFGRDKGVLGKLKGDFNTGKRDRCVQLNLPASGQEDPAAWVELVNKLKECIVHAFDGAITEREEEVKRGEAQRMTVGWNFCTWFLLKESLAHSFEGMNLDSDALIVYEELEATFFQVLKEQNLSWFGKLGANGPHDDSLPILDTTRKPYREMLLHSSITIFDFRVYVFARQCVLLGKMGRITEVAKRGEWFVASLTRRLKESEADLADNFVESWTYTTCLDIVQKCDEWSRIDRPNGDYSGLVAYESARSELLDIARVQVERIGIAARHLPNIYPFAPTAPLVSATEDVLFESSSIDGDGDGDTATPDESSNVPDSRPKLSNAQLLDAIVDSAKFRSLYTNLTKKAIMAYEACGKVNSVVRLRADLAALAMFTKDWERAYNLCRHLAKDCAELRVVGAVTKYALQGALRAHSALEKEKDEEWAGLAVALLRASVSGEEDAKLHSESTEGSEEVPLGEVIEGLRSVEVDMQEFEHPLFSCLVPGEEVRPGKEADVMEVDVQLDNRLNISVAIDRVVLHLEGPAGEDLTFSSDATELRPGVNQLTVHCHTSIQGLFTLRAVIVQLGIVSFTYTRAGDEVLHVRRHPQGVRIKLSMPYEVALDEDPQVMLDISTGQCSLKNARLGLESVEADVRYLLESATSRDLKVSADDSWIQLGDLQAGQSLAVAIPYAGVAQGENTRARIVLTHDSPESNAFSRLWIDTQGVAMGLPLTVNVQDFFRPNCLISHFTIASDGREYIRVASVELQTADEAGGFEVDSHGRAEGDDLVVTPSQPLSCLFKIRRTSKRSSQEVLRLSIRYRSIDDEVKPLLEKATSDVAASATSRRAIASVLAERSLWLQEYLLDGAAGLRAALSKHCGASAADDMLKLLEHIGPSEAPIAGWRTLEIPVDVPQGRLLTTVRIEPDTPPRQVYEGRALAMTLHFATSFAWAGADVDTEPTVIFDVQVSAEDWIILGKKKGSYTATPASPTTQRVVLVPMRSGDLFLPTVSVQLLSSLTGGPHSQAPKDDQLICETHVENAAQVVHVLPANGVRTALVPIRDQGWDEERM